MDMTLAVKYLGRLGVWEGADHSLPPDRFADDDDLFLVRAPGMPADFALRLTPDEMRGWRDRIDAALADYAADPNKPPVRAVA